MELEEEVAALREIVRAQQLIVRETFNICLGIGRAAGVWNQTQAASAKNALTLMLDRACVGYSQQSPYAATIRAFVSEIAAPAGKRSSVEIPPPHSQSELQ